MAGVLHGVWALAGKPSCFRSQSVTPDQLLHTLTTAAKGKAWCLGPGTSRVGDCNDYWQGRDLRRDSSSFLVIFFPQYTQWFSSMGKLQITGRSLSRRWCCSPSTSQCPPS